MYCVLFAKMDQVFQLENKTFKKYWKNGKTSWKSRGILSVQKVGTIACLMTKKCLATDTFPHEVTHT